MDTRGCGALGKVDIYEAERFTYRNDLRADKIAQSVDRRGTDETDTCTPGSFDIVGRRSVSYVNEYTVTYLSDTAPTTSNAAPAPSSPIPTPKVRSVLYDLRSSRRT